MSELCSGFYDDNDNMTPELEDMLTRNIDARKEDPTHPALVYAQSGRYTRGLGTTIEIELIPGETTYHDIGYADNPIKVTVE